MIKITIEENGNAEVLTIPDDLAASLEKHRLALTLPKPAPPPAGRPRLPDGTVDHDFTYGPLHQTIGSLVVSHFIETLVKPVLKRFPTPEIAKLNAVMGNLREQLDAAHAATVLRGGTETHS
jgi:hypothetical protein